MREKIKLKSKKRKLNNQKLNKTNEDNTKITDFIYDKKISKEINEDDLEKYEKNKFALFKSNNNDSIFNLKKAI